MQIILLTLRAASGSTGALFFLPGVTAAFAFKNPVLVNDTIVAAFNIDRFSVYQGIGNRPSATLDDSAESRP